MAQPLMPKATAVWLVENTALTFRQIAKFCGLHELEVTAIADGEVATGMVGLDPIANGQLTKDELARCAADPAADLQLAEHDVPAPVTRAKGPKYTPVNKRGDKPDAISWLLKEHPELPDSALMRLIGTTKPTIAAVRDRTHWNTPNIKPRNPVQLGLCTQAELDDALSRVVRHAPEVSAETDEAAPETALESDDSALNPAPRPDFSAFLPDPTRS